jgi:hypothetical protein
MKNKTNKKQRIGAPTYMKGYSKEDVREQLLAEGYEIDGDIYLTTRIF